MRLGAVSYIAVCALIGFMNPARSEDLGTVNTAFKFFGSDKIGVEAFDDPKVPGVTCYLSRARRGGITGSLGIATDTSDASLACRQTGPVTVKLDQLPDKESVFQASTSFLFKTMQVVRFLDKKRNSLVYLVYSDKLIDGSPKNAISAVSLNVGQ